MRKIIVLCVFLCFVFLIGCSNNTPNEIFNETYLFSDYSSNITPIQSITTSPDTDPTMLTEADKIITEMYSYDTDWSAIKKYSNELEKIGFEKEDIISYFGEASNLSIALRFTKSVDDNHINRVFIEKHEPSEYYPEGMIEIAVWYNYDITSEF